MRAAPCVLGLPARSHAVSRWRCSVDAERTPRHAPPRRRVLAQRGLHEFEVCTLGNLAPSNAEEAKALAPSLDLPVHAHLSLEVRASSRRAAAGAALTDALSPLLP